MIIHFINPFLYEDKKQWDMCFMEEGEQILRQTVTFDVEDSDEVIETFGIAFYEAQKYKITYTEIIIDKPEEWQS